MEKFVSMLKAMEEDERIKDADDCLSQDIPIVHEISIMADDILITESGFCNWENIHLMEDYGYQVFPLERDSFGWLVGGIQTQKGVIAYG